MARASSRPTHAIKEAQSIITATTLMLVGVSNYSYLDQLAGPAADVGFLHEALTSSDLSIFDQDQVVSLYDPSIEEFRKRILDYSSGRSAKGDVFILYFSGHGAVVRGNEFGFCLKDTRSNDEGTNPLPLSIIPFGDIIRTLEAYDVSPVVIIDACYSGMAVNEVQHELKFEISVPHAIVASSSYISTSIDHPDGGPFTGTLLDVLMTGVESDEGSLWPYITVQLFEEALRKELIRRGLPIYQMEISPSLQPIPLVANSAFKPRIEPFTPQYKGIVILLWNKGKPIAMNPNEFRDRLGTGATNNHSKLSLAPWRLLVDVSDGPLRKLSDRGKEFAGGKLAIPRKVIKDPITSEWRAHPEAEHVTIDGVREPTWKGED